MAVAVVVNKAATGAPSRLIVPEAGCLGHVGEGTIAVVSIKAVLAKGRAEDVFKAVVVVVSDANCRGPAHCFQAGLLCHVGKGPISIVLVQTAASFRGIARQASSGKQKDVDPSIVVVIDKGTAASCRFQDVLLGFDPTVDHRCL